MAGETYDDETGRPGWFVGPDRDPRMYQLVEQIHRGGEGVLWRAVRPADEGGAYWAVKVLLGRHLDRGDEETLQDSLNRWERIWDATIERTALLRDIRGIVPAIRVFQAQAPGPDAPSVGAKRTLCLVTPWVDGSDLYRWQKARRRGLPAVIDAIDQLCDLVDQLAAHGLVHRDLSPGNVMVDDKGRLALIDFAFMRPAGARVTHIIFTKGFSAPEGDIDPANDRYSVGAIVYQLLTDEPPPTHDAAATVRRHLVGHGYSAALADHVALLLATDPQVRPPRLGPWARSFQSMVVAGRTPTIRTDVALAVDATHATEIAVAGDATATGRVSPALHTALAADADAPADTIAITAVRRGSGDVVLFALDRRTAVWARIGRRWQRVAAGSLSAGLAAAAHGSGVVSAYFLDTDGQLAVVSVDLAGGLNRSAVGGRFSRVLAATTGPRGRPVVAVADAAGWLLGGEPADLVPVGVRGLAAADITVNQWGELVCAGVDGSNGRLAIVETLAGGWDQAEWQDCPTGGGDVACVGHRLGTTVAVASPAGLDVLDGHGTWARIWSGSTSRVALTIGATMRVQAAGVSSQRVVFAEEGADGRWRDGAAEIR